MSAITVYIDVTCFIGATNIPAGEFLFGVSPQNFLGLDAARLYVNF